MTLLIALTLSGLNCIVSDMRVTEQVTDEGRNTFLKTGVLFPGCIYGACGAVQQSQEFIRIFKEIMRAHSVDDLSVAWQTLVTHSNDYQYDRSHPHARFVLLLSERSTGLPTFHLLDSDTGRIVINPQSSLTEIEAIPFGTGSDIMATTFKTEFQQKTKKFLEFAAKEGRSPEQAFGTFPYIFCLWLNEYSLGEHRYDLEKCGVGGLFHFIYQNGQNEGRQGNAWTLIFSVDDQYKATHSIATLHKIVPLSAGIGVKTYDLDSEEPRGYQDLLCLSGAADYEWKEPTPEMAQRLADEFYSAQKQAAFCGIGFAQRRYRKKLNFIVECYEKDLFDEEGSPHAWVKEILLAQLK